MDNSFYIFSDDVEKLEIERFHICSWDFRDKTSLIEFGIEIKKNSVKGLKELTLKLYIPWIKEDCDFKDFYSKLMDLENSKFIFNDVATGHDVFDDDGGKTGCLQKFKIRDNIVMLPVQGIKTNQILILKINLQDYQNSPFSSENDNLYFRFSLAQKNKNSIALRKLGINKSTIIYDIKLNERRNLPNHINAKFPCIVDTVFYFNIVPNDFNLSFYDSKILKNIRTLEFDGFNKYLDDTRLKKDDLIVVSSKVSNAKDGYSFFNVYSNEMFGVGALAIALLLNLLCGILLFLPSIRGDQREHNLFNLPWELYVAGGIWTIVFSYFVIKKVKPNWIKW